MRKVFFFFLLMLAALSRSAAAGPKKYTTQYDQHFKKYAKRFFGVAFDWRWFKAQAVAESGLNDKAESWVKAKGLMQLMSATFEEIQKRRPEFADIHDPQWNIAAGIYYDRVLWKMWDAIESFVDHLSFTFGAYNAGLRTVQKAQDVAKAKGHDETLWESIVQIASEVPKWRHEETLDYVEKIRGLVEEVER